MARKDKRGVSSSGHNSEAWDKISKRELGDTMAYRDVFETQQLERSDLEKAQTKKSRVITSLVLGVVMSVVIWIVLSFLHLGFSSVTNNLSFFSSSGSTSVKFYKQVAVSTIKVEYCILDGQGGLATDECYPSESEASEHPPIWYQDLVAADEAEAAASDETEPVTALDYIFLFSQWKLLLSLAGGAIIGGFAYGVMVKKLASQNLMSDTTDINQYQGDQHLATPLEILHKFDVFPDMGAHSNVQPSSMISHVMLTNHGLKKVEVARRAKEDIVGKDGLIEYFKGDLILDDDGEIILDKLPYIDEEMGDMLFDASGIPKGKVGKELRRRYNPTKIAYNPDGDFREKVGKYKTVADMLNHATVMPYYEPQRPAGVYIVDTAPVNTMVLAITRAGKGQTYIEPVIDMWLREREPNNIVVNDPKGELLVKHYVRATSRGFQVIQFNLINSLKTDIYNPLGLAAESAREGDMANCQVYVGNIADVFFPVDGAEDPVWPNAANNAFKRAAYGLIDYYREEERQKREYAMRVNMDPKVLDTELDQMWGKVTLYNTYQFFVQLASKDLKNPVEEVTALVKAGHYGNPEAEDFDLIAYEHDKSEAQKTAFLWSGNSEAKMLDLFFSATEVLPVNQMRTLVNNANNSLKSMGGAEKMLASVYGIAITAMSFFTDPIISTLTSGTPSQNTDLAGLSFPRRMGVRFDSSYVKKNHLLATQSVWSAYADPDFTEDLGKDFFHEDTVNDTNWARYYFKGIFPKNTAYIKLELKNPVTKMLIKTFYFKFTKSFQTSLNGRYFITDPVTGEKIIHNGLLIEMVKDKAGKFRQGHAVFREKKIEDVSSIKPKVVEARSNIVIMNQVNYSEKPKAVFMVTPPHLMRYSKLILILIKQLVDLNFDKSYTTKENQKPLYKTRYMLDELGNLQSDGQGIAGFETMLSIGLGQDQQFTIILQTLQQLREIYGDSVDKIVQGNAQPYSALIATPDGWMTMGEMEVGQDVLVPKGGFSQVTGVFPQGVRDVFEIVREDGSSTEACDEHLWDVVVVPPKLDVKGK